MATKLNLAMKQVMIIPLLMKCANVFGNETSNAATNEVIIESLYTAMEQEFKMKW